MPALQSSFPGFFEPKEWERGLGKVEKPCSFPMTAFFIICFFGFPSLKRLLGSSSVQQFVVSFSQTEQNIGGGGRASIISGPTAKKIFLEKYLRLEVSAGLRDYLLFLTLTVIRCLCPVTGGAWCTPTGHTLCPASLYLHHMHILLLYYFTKYQDFQNLDTFTENGSCFKTMQHRLVQTFKKSWINLWLNL